MDLNVFLPDNLSVSRPSRGIGYVVKISENLWGIFVTGFDCESRPKRPKLLSRFDDPQIDESEPLDCDISFDDAVEPIRKNCHKNYLNIHVNAGKYAIKTITIYDRKLDIEDGVRKCIILLYDHREFLKSEVFFPNLCCKQLDKVNSKSDSNLNQFCILKNLLSHEYDTDNYDSIDDDNSENVLSTFLLYNFIKHITGYSRLFSHISNISKFISQILYSTWKERKVSIKTGNFLAALFLNLLFGIIILHWINQRFPNLENDFFILIEDIISYLKALLSWLMGSPAGLKLNRTFNSLLGKFFLNNIDLWWKFLEISRDVLKLSLQIFKYLGMFGITFQAAILADMLAFASLHIYCIYIYAARLYNVQISAIIALLRLFLGKKYNPLRCCVDTCHYNYHQLFIGTLGFTILLFLLPTTLMYYSVFTIFRILIIMLMEILSRTQINILSLPIYSLILWLFHSSKIAGNLYVTIEPKMTAQSNLVVLLVKLKSIPLDEIIKIHKSIPIQQTKKIRWVEIVTKLCNGNILYSA